MADRARSGTQPPAGGEDAVGIASRRDFLALALAGSIAGGLPAADARTGEETAQGASPDFRVWIDGREVPAHLAAARLSIAASDAAGGCDVAIEARDPSFFDGGLQILPSRHAIFPHVDGARATFRVASPAKLIVKRPGDAGATPRQLFLFLDGAMPPSTSRYTRRFPPGLYREDIHARTGDRILIERGAVIHGSINIDGARDVVIEGRGTVIHDGPQNAKTDEGWQSRPNWHALWTRDAEDVHIRGLTLIVRSRTWMIQLNESRRVTLTDVRCVGGSDFNANQDGLDVVGSTDVTVTDCFFKASDDIVALYGNTGFYDETVSLPGRPVERVLIQSCVLCTSISNVLRVSWPKKVFESRDVTMRDCDILYMGGGNCIAPFAVAEFWSEQGGAGMHRDYLFERLRIEAAYSLAQIRQPSTDDGARVAGVHFRDIDVVGGPPPVASTIVGNVRGVTMERLTVGSVAVRDEAECAALLGFREGSIAYVADPMRAEIAYSPGLLAPGDEIAFSMRGRGIRACEWYFGDGARASGPAATHRYPDVSGSWRDGSGLFVVEARVTGSDGSARSVRTFVQLHDPASDRRTADAPSPAALLHRKTFTLMVPHAGGYVFTMMAPEGAALRIDGRLACAVMPGVPLACGTPGTTVETVRAGLALEGGRHDVAVDYGGPFPPVLHWEGPQQRLQQLRMKQG